MSLVRSRTDGLGVVPAVPVARSIACVVASNALRPLSLAVSLPVVYWFGLLACACCFLVALAIVMAAPRRSD